MDALRSNPSRARLGLAVLLLPTLLASLELTVPNLALPAISRDLEPSGVQALWIVDVYGFVLAGSLVTMGALGDRIGRRRLLLIGSAVFGAASVAAAFSTSAWGLVAARAVLGLAGATLMPASLSLAASLFSDPRQRTAAVGAVVAGVAGGTAIGPLVGGWLLQHLWWGAVFLVAVPVAVLVLVLGPFLLPEHREPVTGRPDVLGAVQSLAAVLGVVYALKRTAATGPDLVAGLSAVAGLAVGTWFVRRQGRIRDPLVDLRLFRSRTFCASLGTLLAGVFVLFGANYLLAQYLQLVYGLSPLHAGLWTAPSALGVIAGSTLAPRLVRRIRPGYVVGAGLLLSALGFVALTRVAPGAGLPVLVTGSVVISLGLGPMMTLTTDLVVGAAPRERAGEASALSETAPELGGALGIAVLGSVGAAAYRARMADAVPAGLPPGAAGAAEQTLAGAVAAAGRLPGGVGERLLDDARAAFTDGLHLVAVVSAVVLVATSVLVGVLLRHVPAAGAAGPAGAAGEAGEAGDAAVSSPSRRSPP